MTQILYIAIAIGLLCSTPGYSFTDKRKKGSRHKTEIHQELPMPDPLFAPLKPEPLQSPLAEMRRHHINLKENRFGIDVSHYQGRINWSQVAQDKKVSYAYLKATEGATYVDDTYLYNLREAKRNGVRVGCYHFFSPSVAPMVQLKNFTSNVVLEEQDLIPIVDVELRGRGSLSAFLNRLKTFLSGVEKHYGIKPIIYTSGNFYNKYLAGRFTEYKYMIARYHEEIPELVDDIHFVMWQFTADGRISGISGPVDRSRFMDDYDLSDIIIPRKVEK